MEIIAQLIHGSEGHIAVYGRSSHLLKSKLTEVKLRSIYIFLEDDRTFHKLPSCLQYEKLFVISGVAIKSYSACNMMNVVQTLKIWFPDKIFSKIFFFYQHYLIMPHEMRKNPIYFCFKGQTLYLKVFMYNNAYSWPNSKIKLLTYCSGQELTSHKYNISGYIGPSYL